MIFLVVDTNLSLTLIAFLADLQQRVEYAFSNSIGDRSHCTTYGVGVHHWDELRTANVIPELGSDADERGTSLPT